MFLVKETLAWERRRISGCRLSSMKTLFFGGDKRQLEIRRRWQAKEMYAQCFSLFKRTTHKTKISKKFQHQKE